MSHPWTVRAVRYATRVTPKSAVFYEYATFGEPDVPYRTDYFFWLLSRPEETIVVDVGFGAETAGRMGRELVRAPAQALRDLDIAADRVVLTHLHWDHTANLDLFGDAELLVPAAELDFWSGPLASHPHFASHARAEDLAEIGRARAPGPARRPSRPTPTSHPASGRSRSAATRSGRASSRCRRRPAR